MENNIQILNLSKEELLNIISQAINSQKKERETNSENTLLTRKETSVLLNVNLATIWRWTKQNKLTAKSIGGRIYYDKNEVLNSIVNLK